MTLNNSIRFFWRPLSLLAVALLGTQAHADIVSPESWVAIPPKSDPLLQNLTIPIDASTKGMWSGVNYWPMNGLHAALLPDGRVLTFGSTPDGNNQNGRYFDVWDPALGVSQSAHNTVYDPSRQDSFCAAAVYLSDGSLMISGGNGNNTSTLYETASHASYTAASSMAAARWYSTMINLPDGRPIIMGGMVPYTEGMVNQPDQAIANGWPSMTPEIYESGQWRSLFGAYSRLAFGPDYLRTSYPRAWVAPDGRVFGISADQMWYLDPNANSGNGTVISAGTFKGPYNYNSPLNVGATNTAVMFAPGKILQVGGNGSFNGDELPGSNMATVIDINNSTPQLTEQPRMSYARRYPNSIVLANGAVVITGGATYGNYNSGQPASPVYAAEIWNPATGTWTVGANAARYRGYHSITTLLANGTILSTGGGTPGPVTNLNSEIYYPPYLFQSVNGVTRLATRPVMTAISGLSYSNAAAMQIDMASEEPVSQLVLVGTSSGTHSLNTGQRRIPLAFSQERFRLTTTLPTNTIAPPGYYQVVAIGANGAPSVGVIVGIGQDQATPPVVTTPYTPPDIEQPITTPVVFAGEIVTYSIPATAGTTYSWTFSDTGIASDFSASADITHVFAAPGLYVVTLTAKAASGATATRTFVQAVSTSSTPVKSSVSTAITIESRDNDPDRVWVVNPDNDSVSVISSQTNALIAEISVCISPRTLAVAPDGRIWVANKSSATLSIIDPASLTVTATLNLPYASQPHGMAFAPDGSSVFVVLEAGAKLLKLNPATGAQLGAVDIGPNARHVAIDANSATALVTRFITPPLPGESTATVDTLAAGAEVLVIDTASLSILKTTLLSHSDKADTEIQGSGIPNYLGAPVIAPDGSSAWIPSKQDNIKRGQLRNGLPLNFQNTVRAISSRMDMSTLTEDFTKRIDHDNSGVGSAAAFHPNGVYLFVALETSREVAVVNAINGSELFRIKVGLAPQGIAVSADGNTLYVNEFIGRSVSVMDLGSLVNNGKLIATLTTSVRTVVTEKLSTHVLKGKEFFYDAANPKLARDGYLSCASCHNDAGQDGRIWDLTGFGEGLRNTIALNGRGGMVHGFLHWTANFDETQDFEKQIRDLAGGTGLMADADYNTGTRSQPLGDRKAGISAELDQLAAYLASLQTFAPSIYRNADGSLNADAAAGKIVFTGNCASCHGGNAFTLSNNASALKNVGTNNSVSGLDIPTLRDAWATAPYLHNGSAPTLSAAILAHNNVNLSATDLANVVAYVQQLGNSELLPNVAPAVAITAPANNTAVIKGATVNINASATDSDGTITKVEFYLGTTLLGTDTTAPYGFSWAAATTGSYNISAKAYDNNTAVTTSTIVALTVNPPPNVAPTISLTAPTANVSVTRGTLVTLSATAADSDGTVSKVEFYAGTTLLNSDTAAPYSYNWTTTTTGTFSITAKAYDNSGAVMTSTAKTVTVNQPVNVAPKVTLTAPSSNRTVFRGTYVTLSATANDSDGKVAKVAFYAGTTLLYTDSSAPYSYYWRTSSRGTFSITAKAYDNNGSVTTSNAVTVTVR